MSGTPIFLLGMMGAGKSSVGRELARLRQATFVDLDTRIERLFAASVAELFASGEEYFRACERAALCSLVAEPGFASTATVVATGGGIVTNPKNCATMAAVGRQIYLEVGVEELGSRLSTPAQQRLRPLLSGLGGAALRERLAELLRARDPLYRSAGWVVDAHNSPLEVAEHIFALP